MPTGQCHNTNSNANGKIMDDVRKREWRNINNNRNASNPMRHGHNANANGKIMDDINPC